MVGFGQLLLGPPGTGKTTFCAGMQQLLTALGRKHIIVNLDFANDGELPYDNYIDVRELITVEDTMKEHKLGPNGSLMYCVDYLLMNIDWLEQKLSPYVKEDRYIIIDSPGQVELYTHHDSLRKSVEKLIKNLDLRLCAVHLIDSVFCVDPSKFLSAVLVSLSAQLLLELPHVNLLTKLDLLKYHKDEMPFKLSYYAEAQDLKQLIEVLKGSLLTPEHPFDKKFRKLNEEMCNLIDDFNLVGFVPVAVEDKEHMIEALRQIDVANGYSFSAYQSDPLGLLKLTVRPRLELTENIFGQIQEEYIDVDDAGEPSETDTLNPSH